MGAVDSGFAGIRQGFDLRKGGDLRKFVKDLDKYRKNGRDVKKEQLRLRTKGGF